MSSRENTPLRYQRSELAAVVFPSDEGIAPLEVLPTRSFALTFPYKYCVFESGPESPARFHPLGRPGGHSAPTAPGVQTRQNFPPVVDPLKWGQSPENWIENSSMRETGLLRLLPWLNPGKNQTCFIESLRRRLWTFCSQRCMVAELSTPAKRVTLFAVF